MFYRSVLYKIILIFSSFLLLFCKGKENDGKLLIVDDKSEVNNLIIQNDSLIIEIGNSQLPYYLISAYYNGDYYGYNASKHSLDLFSLTDRKFIKSLFFQSEGPSKIERIQGINVVSKDSIFLMSENNIYLIDNNGDIKNNFKINYESKDSFFEKKHFYAEYNSVFKYNKLDNKIYITTVDMINNRTTKKYYKNFIVSSYDLNTKSIETLKLNYPKEYISDFYGFNDRKYFDFDFKNNSIIYGFSALDNLFTYNLNDNKITRLKLKNNLPNNHTKSISWNKSKDVDYKFKMMTQSSSYETILSSENYIVRFYQEGLPENVTDFSLVKSKRKFISIFDKNFKLITEHQIITNRINQNAAFMVENNIYVPRITGKENILVFLIIKLEKNEI